MWLSVACERCYSGLRWRPSRGAARANVLRAFYKKGGAASSCADHSSLATRLREPRGVADESALHRPGAARRRQLRIAAPDPRRAGPDRKSTRLNSSHTVISYAVFCLKKKKNKNQ